MLRESNNNLPILMVSARQLPADKKHGFLVGNVILDYDSLTVSRMEERISRELETAS